LTRARSAVRPAARARLPPAPAQGASATSRAPAAGHGSASPGRSPLRWPCGPSRRPRKPWPYPPHPPRTKLATIRAGLVAKRSTCTAVHGDS
jgi:hypothetical protein